MRAPMMVLLNHTFSINSGNQVRLGRLGVPYALREPRRDGTLFRWLPGEW